jgi:hypothetical protein
MPISKFNKLFISNKTDREIYTKCISGLVVPTKDPYISVMISCSEKDADENGYNRLPVGNVLEQTFRKKCVFCIQSNDAPIDLRVECNTKNNTVTVFVISIVAGQN